MFCVQESEPRVDPFSNTETDPLSNTQSESSDDEPAAKRMKTYSPTLNPSLNLKVIQIPAFNTPNSLTIFPTTTSTLPQFVNNPLNLANPLALVTKNLNENNIVKNLQSRFSLPARLSITPVAVNKPVAEPGEVVRYKKNGEIAKKRGPPKGYKRKPKGEKVDMSQSFTEGTITMVQSPSIAAVLSAQNTTVSEVEEPEPAPVPQDDVVVPEGTELVMLNLDPADFFPEEPYKMVFSKKKNPKWKNFPYKCEHCFKGYRVASTLISHCDTRHGCVPASLGVPCPCCAHVSPRKKLHKRHLATHVTRRHKIFCPFCIPLRKPDEPYEKESIKYPYDKFPQYWYASEESLRLHKKRKHPYAGLYNYNWHGTWGDRQPNS